jgi:uncharacterized protein involved in outer membrane biogenesis
MSPSTRKRLMIGGGVVGVLIVALLVAPSFFDLNKYKPQLISEVKKATGRDLAIDGPVSLSLLPVPEVSVSGVQFFNVAGAKNPHMVEIKSVAVRPSLFALLGGNIEISRVALVEPKIVLEVNSEGKPNWEFTPSVEEAKPVPGKPSSPKPLSLGELDIENGTLIFSDSKEGLSVVAEKANFSASVGALDGPYSLAGGATINGAPLKVNLSVSAKGTNGYNTDIALEANGKLTFKGTLSELGPNARLVGVSTVSADSLTAFIDTLVGLSGQPAPALPPMLAGKFSFDGAVDVSQTAFAAKQFKIELAGDSGSGSLSVNLKPQLNVDGKLTFAKIDLDRALAELSSPPAAAAKPAASPPAPAAAKPTAPGASSNASVLAGVTAKISIEASEVIYNKTAIRDVALDLDAKGGAVAVPRLGATLPGDMVLQAKSTMAGDPAKPTVSGDFSLTGPKLRETLKWLEVDVSALPADRLTKLSLKGRMSSSGGNIQVSDAAFELDDIKGTGGVVASFSVPASVVASINLDTLDLDPYLAGKAGSAGSSKPAAASTAAASSAPPASAAPGPTFGINTKIAKLIYNKETIGGVEVDVALQGSTLKLNDIKVSNLGGARLAVRGTIANFSSPTPYPDIAFNFDAPDMGKVMKIAGATAPAGLGAVAASGGVAGSIEAMTLRDFSINAMGYSVKATGTLGAPGLASGAPQSVDYKGSLAVNGQTIEGSIDAKLTGKPTITADLKSPSLDIEKLSGASSAPTVRGGKPAASPTSPIDTSPLRSVDASVKLVAANLISAPLHIANADIAATLKEGVLTIEHIKGALYGGALQFSGTVDGSKPTLSFNFKGDVSGIYIGDMLRQNSGSNQFGSVVKVTIDGKLNATGVTVTGSGATSQQLKSSMAGGAELGGHIFVGADKAATAIGSAATGVVGGVIDNTLGTALGAVGQKGGVGVGNILNAISLVLNRFVNRDNPISGRVDIAGGVLTDKSLVVSGNGSTANVATRTNLAASTTDTTVNFMISEDGSAPYLITTARGPLSSPSLNVVRGTAKDPPGMVNTLTNAIPGIGGGGGQSQSPVRSIIPNIPVPSIFGR